MVADKAEIFTKSYKDAAAVHWSYDPAYTLEPPTSWNRTEIVLHITKDDKELWKKHVSVNYW